MLRLPLVVACLLLCTNSIRAGEPVTSDKTASDDSKAIVDQETPDPQKEIADQQDAEKEAIRIEGERLAKQAAEQNKERERQRAERNADVVIVVPAQPENIGKLPSEIEAEEKAARVAAIAKQRELQAARQQSGEDDIEQQTSGVTPDAYGLGINSDAFGRTHTYRTRDGQQLSPIFQNGVKRNAYGLGVHADEFGRAVYDGKP